MKTGEVREFSEKSLITFAQEIGRILFVWDIDLYPGTWRQSLSVKQKEIIVLN